MRGGDGRDIPRLRAAEDERDDQAGEQRAAREEPDAARQTRTMARSTSIAAATAPSTAGMARRTPRIRACQHGKQGKDEQQIALRRAEKPLE